MPGTEHYVWRLRTKLFLYLKTKPFKWKTPATPTTQSETNEYRMRKYEYFFFLFRWLSSFAKGNEIESEWCCRQLLWEFWVHRGNNNRIKSELFLVEGFYWFFPTCACFNLVSNLLSLFNELISAALCFCMHSSLFVCGTFDVNSSWNFLCTTL